MAERPINSFAFLFARLGWMIFGPLAIFLLISAVVRSGDDGWLGVADIGFFAVVAGMIACRSYEFSTGDALTSTGEPMTKAVLTRYAFAVIVLGSITWIGAKLFALGML